MTTQELLKKRIEDLQLKIGINKANQERYEKLNKYKTKISNQIALVDKELSDLNSTLDMLKSYRIKQRKSDSSQLSSTITLMSRMVFPECNYTYFLDGKMNGDFTHTEVLFRDRNGNELIPSISNGDGQQELISLGFVVSLIALSSFTPTLIADEPMAHLSPGKSVIAGEILEKFTEYGLQLFMTSHISQMFDHIKYYNIDLINVNGVTQIASQGYIDNRPSQEVDTSKTMNKEEVLD